MPGAGRFQWNGGGWLGGQLGGTAWMLAGAAVLAPHAPEVAAIWLACFSAANVVGGALWWRRDRLQPYSAIQALLAACAIGGVIALTALHILRPGLRINEPSWARMADEPGAAFALLATVAFLMASFHFMERQARQARIGSREDRTT